MIWKIALQLLTVFVAVLVVILDYLWRDKRTIIFKRTRRILFVIIFLSLPVSIVVIIHDDQSHKTEVKELNEQIDSLKIEIVSFRTQTQLSDNEQQEKMNRLIEDNKSFREMLAPFLTLANKRYPGSSNDVGLKKLQSDMTDLKLQAKKLDLASKKTLRGVYSRYDFNGAKRVISGGRSTMTIGEESSTFQKLVKLEKEKDYTTLLHECRLAIQTTPDWLTPYFFQGIAQNNTGDITSAIASFQYVVDKAPGDPDYALAEEFLKKLKQ